MTGIVNEFSDPGRETVSRKKNTIWKTTRRIFVRVLRIRASRIVFEQRPPTFLRQPLVCPIVRAHFK